jgi:hypothetical protein
MSQTFSEDFDLGEKLKIELSENLPSFEPGNLITINPLCCNDTELKSVFFYLDVEDVNDTMGMESPKSLDSWLTTGNTVFHKRVFLFLRNDNISVKRGTYIETIPVATVLDDTKVLNIPLFLLTKV